MAIAQHSSATAEHPTPVDIVERARRLLGGFDLDPASTLLFNGTVRAGRIYTAADDGLSKPWFGRVFLNPPGGKLRKIGGKWRRVKGGVAKSGPMVWWDTLASAWQHGEVASAFFVGFTLEILRTSQAAALPVQAFARCYPRERLAFGGDDPTHANVLVYLQPRGMAPEVARAWMTEHFGEVGFCEGPGVSA